MLWKENIHAQEQFLHLENYRSKWEDSEKIEKYEKEVKAELAEVIAQDSNFKEYKNDIEPLDSDVL
jgi:hypothetical protein